MVEILNKKNKTDSSISDAIRESEITMSFYNLKTHLKAGFLRLML